MINTNEHITNSTHKVEVVRVDKILPHPNADRLDIINIFGYTTCVVKDSFAVGDLAAFIPPDSIVPNTETFAFLDGHLRIKVKKLRGVVSYGFLVKAPIGAKVGDDVAEDMHITHYDPPEPTSTGGPVVPPPAGYHPTYNIDALLRYPKAFHPGEQVWVTEKIHGVNARFTCIDGVMFAGTHRQWRADNESSVWWRILRQYPDIERFCRENDTFYTLYGEIYGSVQDLKYGCKPGELRFAAFDILGGSQWFDPKTARVYTEGYDIPWVPLVGIVKYDPATLASMAEGQSLVDGADNIREGIVVKPLLEYSIPEIGRVCLKLVSPAYLEKAQ